MIAAISQLAKLAVCLFWGFFFTFCTYFKIRCKMVRYHICVPNLNTGKCRCRTRDEFWCEICRQFIGLNRQHQAAHCASHSFNMESLQMKVLACVVKNIDARRKRRIQRVACVSPPASDVLRLILLHVIRLDFWVLMFLFYWFNFLKWKYNFFFFFFFASNLVILRKGAFWKRRRYPFW